MTGIDRLNTALGARYGVEREIGQGGMEPVSLAHDVQTPFKELVPVVWPDSRWLAYQSDETGRYEIYMRPFLDPGGRVQISTGGGTEPRWSPDGTHLVYRAAHAFWSAALAMSGRAAVVTRRDSLFAVTNWRHGGNRQNYDIARNGRFAVIRDVTEGAGRGRSGKLGDRAATESAGQIGRPSREVEEVAIQFNTS